MANETPHQRKLVLKMSLSLDGFVCGQNGEMDWIFRSKNSETTAWVVATLSQAGMHIMGRRTYQDMAAYWPTSDVPFAAAMNEIPKTIFSRSGTIASPKNEMTTTALQNARAADGGSDERNRDIDFYDWLSPGVAGTDLVADIERLKQMPGDYILAHGGASFAQSLVAANLIDEYRLLIHPIVLGNGLPLFPKTDTPLDMTLIETKSFATGVVAMGYRPADREC